MGRGGVGWGRMILDGTRRDRTRRDATGRDRMGWGDPSIMLARVCSCACVCVRVLMCMRGQGSCGPGDGCPSRLVDARKESRRAKESGWAHVCLEDNQD